MRGVNLIPAPVRQARTRRVRIAIWCAACSVYAAVLIGGCVWLHAREPAPGNWTEVAEKVRAATDGIRHDLELRRAELAAQQAVLNATSSIEGQPDWSMLLALIARAAGDTAWIETTELKPVAPIAPAPGSPARRVVLRLSGLAETQDAVAAFALALERTGLFTVVRMLESRRSAHHGGEAIAFRVECDLEVGP